MEEASDLSNNAQKIVQMMWVEFLRSKAEGKEESPQGSNLMLQKPQVVSDFLCPQSTESEFQKVEDVLGKVSECQVKVYFPQKAISDFLCPQSTESEFQKVEDVLDKVSEWPVMEVSCKEYNREDIL